MEQSAEIKLILSRVKHETQCAGFVQLDTTAVFVQQHRSRHAVSVADPTPVHSLCDGSDEFTASDCNHEITATCHYTLSY